MRRARDGEGIAGYSIRNERYRYTMWGDGKHGEELYDYEVDPREMKNRATDDSMRATKEKLRGQLLQILAGRGKPA